MRNRQHWRFTANAAEDRVRIFSASLDGQVADWMTLLAGLAESDECRTALTTALVGLPFEQIFFETPPLTGGRITDRAEFAAIEANLSSPADSSPFIHSLALADDVAVIENLGGDATLVVPTDLADGTTYNYLLSFLRTAGTNQIQAFWKAAAAATLLRVDDTPVWVSTSGGGVPWLHLRLDTRPKYYSYRPFARRPSA